MTPHILNKNEKEEILKMLKEQFGIEKLNGLLLTNNYKKCFIYQGSLNENEISKIENAISLEKVGIYFAKMEINRLNEKKIRLSIEGSQIMKNQITKNVFELNDEQLKDWLKGNEILVNIPEEKRDFLIIKYKEDFLGTGKASENKISNFMPKSRRLKK